MDHVHAILRRERSTRRTLCVAVGAMLVGLLIGPGWPRVVGGVRLLPDAVLLRGVGAARFAQRLSGGDGAAEFGGGYPGLRMPRSNRDLPARWGAEIEDRLGAGSLGRRGAAYLAAQMLAELGPGAGQEWAAECWPDDEPLRVLAPWGDPLRVRTTCVVAWRHGDGPLVAATLLEPPSRSVWPSTPEIWPFDAADPSHVVPREAVRSNSVKVDTIEMDAIVAEISTGAAPSSVPADAILARRRIAIPAPQRRPFEECVRIARGPQVDAMVQRACSAIFHPGRVLEGAPPALEIQLDLDVLPRETRFGCSARLHWEDCEIPIRDLFLSSPEGGLVRIWIELAGLQLPEAAWTQPAAGCLRLRGEPRLGIRWLDGAPAWEGEVHLPLGVVREP